MVRDPRRVRGAAAGREPRALGPGLRSAFLGVVAAAAAVLPGGCAPFRGQAPLKAQAQGPMLREDAGPRVYAEDEVDVPARPLEPIRPVYPPRMRALGIPGQVEARVIVSAAGFFAGGRILEATNDDFAASARDAIRAARFHPALRAGRPVASWVTVRVHFELDR